MPDMSVGKMYSWAMKDPASLARGFATPDVLEANAAVIVQPGQEALVFIDDDLKHFDQIGTHVMTGTMRVNLADAIRIAQAGGTVHTSFSTAITLFDMRARLLPPETIVLPTAGGEAFLTLSGAYRIAQVALLVRSALPMSPAADAPGAFDLRTDSPFMQDVFRQMTETACTVLRSLAGNAQSAEEAAALALQPGTREELLRQVNQALARTGFVMDSIRLSLAERTCPYCRRQLSAMELRARRCGNAEVGCNRPLESCPSCDAIVAQGQLICHRCRAELLWCDACRAYVQVEKGRFCTRCKRACYPFLPR